MRGGGEATGVDGFDGKLLLEAWASPVEYMDASAFPRASAVCVLPPFAGGGWTEESVTRGGAVCMVGDACMNCAVD